MPKNTKSKLLFIYDMPVEHQWLDGLWAALQLLENDFDITYLNLQVNQSLDPDTMNSFEFVLGWGAWGSPVANWIITNTDDLHKRGLCIGGNAKPPEFASVFNVLFYETKWYRPQIDFHPNIVHAFGVNTDIYNNEKVHDMAGVSFATPVVWDYIGVGAFASWKRWEKMKDKTGNRLVIGEYQKNNEQESLAIVRDLVSNGVMVSGMVNPFDLSNLYRWSRKLYVPADINGGGERAVLEARSCGCEVEIEDDNPKLKELLDCPIPSHLDYAKKLKGGILSVL